MNLVICYYDKSRRVWRVGGVGKCWLPCSAFVAANGYLFLNTMRAHIHPGARCNPRKLVYEYLHFKRHEPQRTFYVEHYTRRFMEVR